MTISALQVKKLREVTGAGMMDCKEALTETKGDFDEAIQWLRKKGIAKADRKEGRATAEGLIGVASNLHEAVLVEINSETDFVARNDSFQELVRAIAKVALLNKGDLLKTHSAPYLETNKLVGEAIKDSIATIGENLAFRRSVGLHVEKGVVAFYMHNFLAPDLGKLGVLVGIETEGDPEIARDFAKQVAMHVAASNPLALSVADLDPIVVEREKEVFSTQARESKKPENIIEKMVEGRLRKFYEEAVLLDQKFVIDQEMTVNEALKNLENKIGKPAKIVAFKRFALGEGFE